MKLRVKALIFICLFCLCSGLQLSAVSAAEDTAVSETVESVQDETEDGTPRGVKIAGFLVIFTAAMGTTAFIAARPKLKMLREMSKKQ